MNSRDAFRRLRAHEAGRPLPRGERLSIRVANPRDILLVSFVRTGGESRPWGIAFGHPGEDPRYLTVPEGRDRDLVSTIALRFGEELLTHLRSPAIARPAPQDESGLAPIRQVWLANSSHLDMLHHLAYAYTFTRAGEGSAPALNALGRACSWLFRESQLPGQQHIVVATQALKEAFTFPAEDVRQGHLGFLVAWMSATGDGRARLHAAMEAERRSVSTTLDPSVERDPLEPLLEGWRKEGRSDASPSARKIAGVLERELERRVKLVDQAWEILRSDPRRENLAVSALVDRALSRQWRDWAWTEARIEAGETPYIPSVETDRQGAGAAMAFLRQSAAAEFRSAILLHDDGELLAEALADGNAFSGVVVQVRDEGIGRTTMPVWTLSDETRGPLRLREEQSVCVVGLPRRAGRIRSISTDADGDRFIEVALTNLKTSVRGATGRDAIPPKDPAWIGQPLTFATASAGSIEEAKIRKLWAPDVPGAWLTRSSARDTRTFGSGDTDEEVADVG